MTASEQKLTVEVNTDVVFKWSGYHNVYMFPNKADFDNCDFSEATDLASNLQNPFTFKTSILGVFYFSCPIGGHCKYGKQKLALNVTSMFTLPLISYPD